MIRKCDSVLFGMVGNKFIKDEDISNEVVAIYSVMRTVFYDVNKMYSTLNLQTLYDVLGVKGSKFVKQVRDTITWLIDNEYIELFDMLYNPIEFDGKSQSMFMVSFSSAEIDEEHNYVFAAEGGFTKIPLTNMVELLNYINSHKGIKKYQLIRYYLVVGRTCSNDSNFGYITQDTLCDVVGISENTCVDYNKLLKKLGLIDYSSEYGKVTKKGNFKMSPTMFGHYNVVNQHGNEMTEEQFKRCVEERINSLGYVKVDTTQIANKKSNAMKKVWADRKAQEQVQDELSDMIEVLEPTIEPCEEEVVEDWGTSFEEVIIERKESKVNEVVLSLCKSINDVMTELNQLGYTDAYKDCSDVLSPYLIDYANKLENVPQALLQTILMQIKLVLKEHDLEEDVA